MYMYAAVSNEESKTNACMMFARPIDELWLIPFSSYAWATFNSMLPQHVNRSWHLSSPCLDHHTP
jgi:hypothetical protein